MNDFIKDLNVIDFLGMLLPGSLYVMAARELIPMEELLGYWGEEQGAIAKTTLLLVAGYVIGMIFSEIGDIGEKLLWHIGWIDPRTYAARKTKLIQQVGDSQPEALKKIRKGDCVYLATIPNQTDMRKRNLFEGFRMMARNLVLVLLLLLFCPGTSFLKEQPHKFLYGAACVVLTIRYYHYSYLKYKYAYEDYLTAAAP